MWDHDKSAHERGYGWQWKKLRRAILERDGYVCQPCLDKMRITPASEVDHIIPKAKGGTDDPDNLQAICEICHREKTAKENGAKPKGSEVDGTPSHPGHPWNK